MHIRLLLIAAALLLAGLPVAAQDPPARVGDDPDPVLAAIALNQAKGGGPAARAVLGRVDDFPDVLAATALAGGEGVLLLTDGGPAASLRTEVAAELDRALVAGSCADPAVGPTVHLVGGTAAVSQAVEDELSQGRFCVRRVDGPTRIETAIAVADAVTAPSGSVVLARSDDWADAGSVGAWAAATRSRVVVTPTSALAPAVEDALRRWAPDRVVLVGGVAALSRAVEEAAAAIAPVERVAGGARDATAVAIAEQLWAGDRSGDVVLADGYGPGDWTYLFAGAAFAATRSAPILYTADDQPTAATAAYLHAHPGVQVTALGPAVPAADLGAVRVALQPVADLTAPLALQARPGTAELWVAERAGRVRAIGPEGTRTVLDISATVSTAGERGLLGLAFHPSGDRLFTSSTDRAGDSVIDAFDVVGDAVDAGSRRELLQVDQPASNHNGGDLQWGPDGYLWWSLGDGGASDDRFGNGQNPRTLLASLVRIDVDGGTPYVIPPGNPFADGQGGAPELFAYGLRNPFRFSFDPLGGDLYIADVGQDAVEEIDWVSAGSGAGSNFGWSVFEGTQPFAGGSLPEHVPPVWEERHRDGNCSITGGVVYRGRTVPELYGAYLYSDLCRNTVRAIVVEEGRVVQDADLGVSIPSPVGFGVDHDGEVHVLSLGGDVVRIVPG